MENNTEALGPAEEKNLELITAVVGSSTAHALRSRKGQRWRRETPTVVIVCGDSRVAMTRRKTVVSNVRQ